MLHEARQTFIHEEAKKLRAKLKIEMNTPESFLIVKEILDRYDNAHSKLHQPTVISAVCDCSKFHDRNEILENKCISCGEKLH